ncbi:MAG: nitrogenase component 1 [Sporomusaceae bacterium]|nr:nitrogenase component 1 [Sporomusaceae bacterium]
MSKFIERPRYLCTMGGAVATLKALPRAVSILHSSPGCGGNFANALNGAAGYLGSGYCAGQALPSSNIYERDIVFGGEERLAEQIASTLEIVDADLYFVVTGCMVDLIGDDAVAVAKRFRQQGKPVFGAETGGFKGNSYKGYDIVLSKLFAEFVEPSPVKNKQLVNLFGLVPVQDVFWKGNLNALMRLIGKLGYQVNTFFGEGETLANLKQAAAASLNIVVSDIYGIQPAEVFQEIHDVPYIVAPLPIGPSGCAQFLRQIGAALGIEKKFIDKIIVKEQQRYYSYAERLADVYNDLDFQRYSVVIADANYAQAIARFIADDFGWLPELVIVTDILDDTEKQRVEQRFTGFQSGVRPQVVFDTDTSAAAKHLSRLWPRNQNSRYYDAFSPAFVFGSSLDREFAESIKAPHLSIAYPVSNRVVLDRAYLGYEGSLTLIEDIATILVQNR